jgi:hypothetical protein
VTLPALSTLFVASIRHASHLCLMRLHSKWIRFLILKNEHVKLQPVMNLIYGELTLVQHCMVRPFRRAHTFFAIKFVIYSSMFSFLFAGMDFPRSVGAAIVCVLQKYKNGGSIP